MLKRNGAVGIKLNKTDIILMIVALLVSAAVNMLVGAGVLSAAYISLGLLITAAGILLVQIRRQRRDKSEDHSQDHPKEEFWEPAGAPSDRNGSAGGKLLTGLWLLILLGWAATLAYAVFFG